jgi:Protein of unknown function DUF58
VLTGRGIATGCLGAVLCIGGWVLSLPELAAGGGALLALVVGALVWVWFPTRHKPKLTVDIDPNPAMVGTTATVFASVQLRSFRPAMVRASLSDGRSIRLWSRPGRSREQSGSFPIPLTQRGRLAVGPFRVVRVDPIGFATRPLLRVAEQTLVVWPAVHDAAPVEPNGRTTSTRFGGAVGLNRSQQGDAEPVSLRPYVAGDELRLMHWTASARGRGLMVRTFEEQHPKQPVVVLDDRFTSHSPQSFEFAVDVAASLMCGGGPIPHLGRLHTSTKLGLWSELATAHDEPPVYDGVQALNRLADLLPYAVAPTPAAANSTVGSPAAVLDGVDVLITGPYAELTTGSFDRDVQVLVVDPLNQSLLCDGGQLGNWTHWIN